MEMTITFPGGDKVNAEFDGHIVQTDQPAAAGGEGEGSAPTPFQYFLASLGTCAGIYVLSFCKSRSIPTEGLALNQRMVFEPAEDGRKRLTHISLTITLPHGFPEKYRDAIVRAANLCTVKKVLMDPPEFTITTVLS